jgi:UDP-N-acetylglucosamine--N-acetylmuramyl-(pentapeptide) pyrophosphoryl-undecaprenol N-acetylglucosamine transferase
MNAQLVNQLRILIMAGGTGGHVFPALAVAEELRNRGAQLNWLGTARGIENQLVPKANIPLHLIKVEGVRGKGILGLGKAPFLILYALLQAMRVIRDTKTDVVLGFGGFASGPGGVAAKLLNKPLVIHEQNAVAGTTNRLLAKRANQVLSAFPNSFLKKTNKEMQKNIQVVGNPVRKSITDLTAATERYTEREQQALPLQLLILGGSLGAKAINELVPQALAKISVDARPVVRHQTGKDHADTTQALYKQYQVDAQVDAFIDDMAAAYASADLVICRAGALTVSELMAAGVASLLIPLPNAIDDHQTANAKHLTQAEAGIACAQRELTPETLAEKLKELLKNRESLKIMATKAQALAIRDSAAQVADSCFDTAKSGRAPS